MVYALKKFHRYLLGGHMKFFMDHFDLKCLVNKPMLKGRICKWLLLLQYFSFEVIVKPQKHIHGPNHLLRVESNEVDEPMDDQLPYTTLFRVEVIPQHLEEIALFLTARKALGD